MNTKVTIGLCVKNGAKVVKVAFNSVSIQDYPHELMKLVIVDNNSSDNTFSLATAFAKETDIKTSIFCSKLGLGGTRQMAVDNAEGDYILWVDDDLALSKDFVRNQVEFMEKNPNVGAAKGVGVEIASQSTILSIAAFGSILDIYSKAPKKIGTGGSIYRLKALESVRGFDTRINGAGEDIDVSRRVLEKGWNLSINNSAKLFKKDLPTTPKSLWKKNRWYGYSKHFLFHKYVDLWSLIDYFPPLNFYVGFKMSCSIYRLTNMKKAFFFPFFYFYGTTANFFGFVSAHLDGYGHVNTK